MSRDDKNITNGRDSMGQTFLLISKERSNNFGNNLMTLLKAKKIQRQKTLNIKLLA